MHELGKMTSHSGGLNRTCYVMKCMCSCLKLCDYAGFYNKCNVVTEMHVFMLEIVLSAVK